MIPAWSYDMVCTQLRPRRERPSEAPTPKDQAKLVGLLFARPNSPLAKSEIVSSIDYYHFRSGHHVDFYCAGYGAYWEGRRDEFPDQRLVADIKHTRWSYSDARFDAFRRDIETRSRWTYSGGADLLLATGRYSAARDTAFVDFSSCVVCQLDQMRRDNAILSVETFFEAVFRFAEKSGDEDPTWKLSDHFGKRAAGSAIKNLVMACLPSKSGDDAKALLHFAVHDVGREE